MGAGEIAAVGGGDRRHGGGVGDDVVRVGRQHRAGDDLPRLLVHAQLAPDEAGAAGRLGVPRARLGEGVAGEVDAHQRLLRDVQRHVHVVSRRAGAEVAVRPRPFERREGVLARPGEHFRLHAPEAEADVLRRSHLARQRHREGVGAGGEGVDVRTGEVTPVGRGDRRHGGGVGDDVVGVGRQHRPGDDLPRLLVDAQFAAHQAGATGGDDAPATGLREGVAGEADPHEGLLRQRQRDVHVVPGGAGAEVAIRAGALERGERAAGLQIGVCQPGGEAGRQGRERLQRQQGRQGRQQQPPAWEAPRESRGPAVRLTADHRPEVVTNVARGSVGHGSSDPSPTSSTVAVGRLPARPGRSGDATGPAYRRAHPLVRSPAPAGSPPGAGLR